MIILSGAGQLKAHIIKSGYSISGFATQIGVSPATLSLMFNKNNTISPRTAKLIVDELGTSFNDYFQILVEEA
ncbi:helix-turn-helix transcriptional regulator [Staphylococcus nepalensis]|uniref:helix-turn-helix domain-containing protein n=1 Tax=Staphylococcus nepalensis TaxID=214473 RepID=UPI003F4962F9